MSCAVVLFLLATLYFSVFVKLVHDWYVLPDFSHGFLVALFAVYLLWTKRALLLEGTVCPTWGGLFLLIFGLLLLLLGALGAELFLTRISGIFVVVGTVWLLAGGGLALKLLPCCSLLLLAIPIPQVLFFQVTSPLQHLAASLATCMLQVARVPVLQDGNLIRLPSITLEVAEACSGIRSLFSLCTVAVLYSYFAENQPSTRVVLVLCSIPIAVISNALRILGTGLLVQYRGAKVALGFFHEFSGLLIFMLAVAMLMVIHVLLSRVRGLL